MMSDVEERDLAAIGAGIQMPTAATRGSIRARREQREPVPTGDRLSEIATWWATVSGTAPPRRVEQLWSSSTGPAPAGSGSVVVRSSDLPKTVLDAIALGVGAADDAVDAGADLLLVSLATEDRDEVGWQVLAVHLLDINLLEAIGWPQTDRTTDAQWSERVAAVRDGLRRVRGIRNQPERLLTEIDSPALAAGTALLLQAAARRTPVLLDGPGAAACALLAHRIARAGRSWWQATDAGHLGLHDRILTELRLPPLTRFGLPTEDGTAARIGLSLLETAVARALAGDADLPDEVDVPEVEDPEMDEREIDVPEDRRA
jgi:nicotinate-nucleotide--dimethylbenzimidazole phosphoribosyltransferase